MISGEIFINSVSMGKVMGVITEQREDSREALAQSLVTGLNEIERRKIDRLVLTLYESEPDENTVGRWLPQSEFNYYSSKVLDERELDMIDKEKSYSIVSLVSENPFGQVKYLEPGIEVFHRTHVHPFLPKLDKRSNFNYVSKGGIYLRNELGSFIEDNVQGVWTAEMVDERVRNALSEIKAKLKKN